MQPPAERLFSSPASVAGCRAVAIVLGAPIGTGAVDLVPGPAQIARFPLEVVSA